jgi:hypothetical protein
VVRFLSPCLAIRCADALSDTFICDRGRQNEKQVRAIIDTWESNCRQHKGVHEREIFYGRRYAGSIGPFVMEAIYRHIFWQECFSM